MSGVLVFLEHQGGALHKGALGVLSKAASLGGGEVAAVIAGAGPLAALAKEAGTYGATKVYVAEDASLDPPLPQPRVDVVEQVVRAGGFDTVLFTTSVLGADVAAGLAARLDAGINWDLVDLVDQGAQLIGKRPAIMDSLLVDVGWRSPQRVALFRGGTFEAVAGGSGEPQIESVSVSLQAHSTVAKIVSQKPQESEGPSIEDADVIIAGGIGLGGAEHFAMAEELASLLGGAVGATRAAVYKGWYPYATQIGQTGKTVTPKLYIALGISGAVQHKVGMQNSKTIISVNKDAGAPIFEYSDLAIVGDVHTIVPKLIELLKERKGA